MSHDTGAGIRRQHALETLRGVIGAVGDDDHPCVNRIANPDSPAVVHADPRRACRHVEQGVQDRPVGDRIGAVAHGFRLAVRRRDGPGVEVVPPDHDRCLDLTRANELVDRQSRPCAVAVPEPADPGGQALERHAIRRQLQPPL
jgi:hypothetical protein